ncbi:MAG: short-chain fatty acid transporter [Bacteriovoracia bacterium]
MLEKFGEQCEIAVRRYMPDPFVLVLMLSIFTFGLSLWFTPETPSHLLKYWNTGFWELLSFAMQMVLIIATGEAIADSRIIHNILKKICSIPKTPKTAVFLLAFFSMILGWAHWGLGLVVASLLAREMSRHLNSRKVLIHYPLMGAAAYMSMLLWHAGTTASAPLLINTPKHFLYNEIGLIPLTETIFLPSNLVVCGLLTLVIPFVLTRLIPRRQVKTFDHFDVAWTSKKFNSSEKAKTFAEKLERSYLANLIVGTMGLAFLFQFFRNNGLDLNHNVVNLLFLSIGLLMHRNPIEYSRSITNSVKGTAGIILQFPFYGGIMGILRESGLGHEIAQFFVQFSTVKTLPFFAYLASVATKLLIPSGGGEWAVEGPVMLQTAKALGAPIGLTTMGIAYGNMVGNMFQPFWAIPLLSIMGLKAKEIMGYCLVVFFFAFPILGIALLGRL